MLSGVAELRVPALAPGASCRLSARLRAPAGYLGVCSVSLRLFSDELGEEVDVREVPEPDMARPAQSAFVCVKWGIWYETT